MDSAKLNVEGYKTANKVGMLEQAKVENCAFAVDGYNGGAPDAYL